MSTNKPISNEDELWIIHYKDDSESTPMSYAEMQQIVRDHQDDILYAEVYHPEEGR